MVIMNTVSGEADNVYHRVKYGTWWYRRTYGVMVFLPPIYFNNMVYIKFITD